MGGLCRSVGDAEKAAFAARHQCRKAPQSNMPKGTSRAARLRMLNRHHKGSGYRTGAKTAPKGVDAAQASKTMDAAQASKPMDAVQASNPKDAAQASELAMDFIIVGKQESNDQVPLSFGSGS